MKETSENYLFFGPRDVLEEAWDKIVAWNNRNGFSHINDLEALMILVPEHSAQLATSMENLNSEISMAHVNAFLRAYKLSRDQIIRWHHRIRTLENRLRNIGKLHSPNEKPIAIKKNSNNVGYSQKQGRMMFFGNPAYKKVEEQLIADLQTQNLLGAPIEGALVLTAQVEVRNESWWDAWLKSVQPEKYSGTDFDNKTCTICDLLKKALVIHDDSQFVWGKTRKLHGKPKDREHYLTEIKIYRFKEDEWHF